MLRLLLFLTHPGWLSKGKSPALCSAPQGAPRLQHWVCWAAPAGWGNNGGAKGISGLGSSRYLQLSPMEEEGLLCTSEGKDVHAWGSSE